MGLLQWISVHCMATSLFERVTVMKLSRKSWHYKLNTILNRPYQISDKDLCSYFWQTVRSFFWLIFVTVFICSLLFILGSMWYITIPVVLVMVLLCFVMYQIAEWLRHRKNLPFKPDGFIKASYKSFRKKTCHRIEWS